MGDTKLVYPKDGLQNLATGLGTSKDTEVHNAWGTPLYDAPTLSAAYQGDWIARQSVDVPVEEIRRKWRKVTTPSMTSQQVDQFRNAESRLDVVGAISRALKWSRLYGGAGVYVATEPADEGGMLSPLDVDKIRKGARLNFIDFDRQDVTPSVIGYDEYEAGLFYRPLTYTSNRSKEGLEFHHTRFLRFDGLEIPRDAFEQNNYWGWSYLAQALPAIERCNTVSAGLAQLLKEANVDVISIPDLISKLTNATTAAKLRTRFAEGNLIKSMYNLMLLDEKEQYHRHELGGSLTGLIQLMAAYYQAPAAAAGIPVTKLLGVSPGGLNATGESDLENYYSMCDAIRTGRIDPALTTIDAAICQVEFGRQFDDWSYEWAPLWQESAKEQAETNTHEVNQLASLQDRGVIPASTVANEVMSKGIVTSITPEYVDDLKEVEGFGDEGDGEPEGAPEASTAGAATSTGQTKDVAKEALAGAQTDKLIATVEKVNAGTMSRSQGFGILSASLPSLSEKEINAILGTEADIKAVRENLAEISAKKSALQSNQPPAAPNGSKED